MDPSAYPAEGDRRQRPAAPWALGAVVARRLTTWPRSRSGQVVEEVLDETRPTGLDRPSVATRRDPERSRAGSPPRRGRLLDHEVDDRDWSLRGRAAPVAL